MVASACVRSKVVVLSLFIHCLLLLLLSVGFSIRYMFCFAEFSILSSFAIISLGNRESWLLYFCCVMNVLSLLSFFDSSSWCYGLVCNK